VESTYNWYWLVDGLMEQGYRVPLANTAAIQQYQGLKYTDDHSDARWLAHLLRLAVLPEGYIYPRAHRPVRDLLRKRSQLVRQRTTHLLSIQNLLTPNTHFAIQFNSKIKSFYQRKKAKTKVVVAIKAVAHKLCRACYYIMKDRVAFNVTKAFGQN